MKMKKIKENDASNFQENKRKVVIKSKRKQTNKEEKAKNKRHHVGISYPFEKKRYNIRNYPNNESKDTNVHKLFDRCRLSPLLISYYISPRTPPPIKSLKSKNPHRERARLST